MDLFKKMDIENKILKQGFDVIEGERKRNKERVILRKALANVWRNSDRPLTVNRICREAFEQIDGKAEIIEYPQTD